MGKNLKDMTRQEQTAYFKSKDYCGEELKIVMDAINYGIGADYLANQPAYSEKQKQPKQAR